ncbi:MAG: rhodanese-like domain-containing protein [Pyrinomonadaceae bacterium]
MFEVDHPSYASVRPAEVQARMPRGEALRLIDVREPEEYEIAVVEGAELLSISEFGRWAGELNTEGEFVIMCTPRHTERARLSGASRRAAFAV